MMRVNHDMCMHCGACVGSCPFNALFLHETYLEFLSGCTSCGLCVKVCPVGAIEKLAGPQRKRR